MRSTNVHEDSLRPRLGRSRGFPASHSTAQSRPQARPDLQDRAPDTPTLGCGETYTTVAILPPICHSGDSEHGLDSNSDSQTTCWVNWGKLLAFSESPVPQLKMRKAESSYLKSLLTVQRNHTLEVSRMVPGTWGLPANVAAPLYLRRPWNSVTRLRLGI